MEVSYLLMPQNFINSKKKISEKKDYALCLHNASKDFTINNMKKKTGLKAVAKSFLLILILLIVTILKISINI